MAAINPEKLIRDAMRIKRKRAQGEKLTKKEQGDKAARALAKRYERYLEKEQKQKLTAGEKAALMIFTPAQINLADSKGSKSVEARARALQKRYEIDVITPEIEFGLQYATPGAVARAFGIAKREGAKRPPKGKKPRKYKKVEHIFSDVEVNGAYGYDAWKTVAGRLRGHPHTIHKYDAFIYETKLFYMVDVEEVFSGAFNGETCPAFLKHLMYDAASDPVIKRMLFNNPDNVLILPPFSGEASQSGSPKYFYLDEWESADYIPDDYGTSRIYYKYIYEGEPGYDTAVGEIVEIEDTGR